MCRAGLIAGCIAALSLVAPAGGAIINFSNPQSAASQGIHVYPTGPDNLPMPIGTWEVNGGTAGFLLNTVLARYSSGVAKFDQPVRSISFDVDRLSNSEWTNWFTLSGYQGRRRVAITRVDLMPVGDTTHITITAPSINHIAWGGQGWMFHPYAVRDFHLRLVSEDPMAVAGVPRVGSAVPEPGSAGICGLVLVTALLRRRRPVSSPSHESAITA